MLEGDLTHAASITHKNLCTVLAWGYEGQRVYLATESPDGATRSDETDVSDFGYPGISMQTDEAYFVHIKKKSVHQSLDSVTFQTHKDWTQYSSHHMVLSSKRKMFASSALSDL